MTEKGCDMDKKINLPKDGATEKYGNGATDKHEAATDPMDDRSDEKDTRFRFGVAKFGSRKHSALTVSLPGGIALAVCISAVGTALAPNFERLTWAATFAVMLACVLTPSVMGIWLAVVDRDTIRGANQSPEDNVENTWFTNAAATAASFTLGAAGVGSAIAGFAFPDASAVSLTLLGVCYFMIIAFAVAYLWEKKH